MDWKTWTEYLHFPSTPIMRFLALCLVLLTVTMAVLGSPKPSLGKNIRFAPTTSSNNRNQCPGVSCGNRCCPTGYDVCCYSNNHCGQRTEDCDAVETIINMKDLKAKFSLY
eukprot:TRINITY_DN2840_c0_g1_i1.p1 TRINITY_DN2840_c0_g1~~TRINITY_DN2840_c0_g1_i1.p1  ORF type:complete len:111 (-),score=17.04 TRINITY_DN2840_c0_g1_i1:18-350(-)